MSPESVDLGNFRTQAKSDRKGKSKREKASHHDRICEELVRIFPAKNRVWSPCIGLELHECFLELSCEPCHVPNSRLLVQTNNEANYQYATSAIFRLRV